MASSNELRLAIAGLGAIGLAVARRVDAGDVPGLALAAVAARDQDKAQHALAGFRSKPAILRPGSARRKRRRHRRVPAVEAFRRDRAGRAGAGAHLHAAVRGRADRSHGPGRAGAPDRGAHRRADRGAPGSRCRARRRRRQDRLRHHRHAQAARGPCRRAAARRARPVGGGAEGALAGVRRQRARGHRRLSRQRQCGGGAVARRHRPGQDAGGGVGRPRP